MINFIKKAGCSVLLALLIISAMAGVVSNLFNGSETEGVTPSFSAVATVLPDGGTVDADLSHDLSNPEIDVSFEVEFVGESDPLATLFGTNSIGGSVPKQDDTNYVIPSPTPNTGNNNSGTGNSDNTNNDGNSSSGGANIGSTQVPLVSNSALAYTIKSHTYSTGLDIFQSSRNDISTDTTALLNAINSGSNKCSFIAVRISDGATIAYNANALYRCASSYKAFASLYAYKQVEAGVYNFNTTLTYTSADYYPGSGIIKGSAFGTLYSLKTVADYSITYSDNAAYTMLQRYIDKQQLVAYAASLGCPNYAGFTSNWPNVSAIDEALWWAEIYNYACTSTYGQQLYNVFLSATNAIIKTALYKEHSVAHKSGSMSYYYHDAGIVHSEDPYLLVVLTHNPNNYSSKNDSYFNPIVREIDKLINP